MGVTATAKKTTQEELQALLKEKAEIEGMMRDRELHHLLKEKEELEGLLTQRHPSEETPLGNRVASGLKSAVAGAVGGLADTAALAHNLPAMAHNALKESVDQEALNKASFPKAFIGGYPVQTRPHQQEIPLIPSATEAIDQGIDRISNGYTKTPKDQKVFNEGLKFVGSLAGPGALAKTGVRGVGALGTLRPTGLAGGFAAGAAGEALHDKGALASFGGSLGAGLAVDALLSGLKPTNLKKAAVTMSGFGKRHLDLEAIDSAQKLNIDMPNHAFTSSAFPHLTAQIVGRFPIIGHKLKSKISQASQDYKQAFENMLDSVGPQKTEDIALDIAQKYALMNKSIPHKDTILANDLLKTIQELETTLDSTFQAAPTKALLDITNKIKSQIVEDVIPLPQGFEKMPSDVQEKVREAIHAQMHLKPVSVKKLVRQKAELNKFMKDRNLFDRTDGDTLTLLKRIQSATDRELERYGQHNKTFLTHWKEANESYAKTAKREKLDDFLSGKLKPTSKEDVAFGSLANLLEHRESQKMLKNTLGADNYEKVQDFVNAARAMQSLNKNNPNPSGTAAAALIYALFQHPVKASKIVGALFIGTGLLNNKKFLNLATRYAKEPSLPLEQQIDKIVRQTTGLSLQSLVKELHSQHENDD